MLGLKGNRYGRVGRMIMIPAFLWGMTIVGFASEPDGNLFPDSAFRQGFRVIDGPKTLGILRFPEDVSNAQNADSNAKPNADSNATPGTSAAPDWDLAQHNSRFNLSGVSPARNADGEWEAVTPGSVVRLRRDADGLPTLTLGVFAENEYEAPRVLNQPWPHLLLIHDFPPGERVSLAGDDPLFFSADLRIVTCENKMAEGDYQSSIHCGQVSAYFIIRNADPDSPDRDDYIWFGLPIFDSRRDFPPPYAALDGDPAILGTGKLIWLPGGPEALMTLYGGENPRSGEWVHLKANLKTYLADALAEAKRRNFLTHTQTNDLEICHFNLGWEVTGTFHCVMEIRNPRLF